MYKKVSTDLNFCQREEEIIKFWEENEVFPKIMKSNQNNPTFTFYDGPPTANGKPHIGHILTRVIKDIIPRYKTMKGYHVLRKAGWDTHGLPVELEVEKALGMNGKQDIEKYGIEPFIKKCKESVWKYKGEWERMSQRVGYWADMENPYITYEDNYIESVWWSLKKIADKDLIYKGHKIVPYCPRCGTSLSSHEVAQGYRDVTENTIFVKFKLKNEDNKYFLAWTTTPWTLPSNVALCMNAKEEYVEVLYQGETLILAKELVESIFADKEYKIVSTKKGKEYEYVEYEPLYNLNETKQKAYYVTNDKYVTLTDGTGIVHIAPAFGEDDANVGRKYKLPFVQVVDSQGEFIEPMSSLVGVFVKDADPLIVKDLKERNLVFKEQLFTHSYPFCWRCDTPLIYYARSTWFVKVTAEKEKLIKNNQSINWIPANIKNGRMGNFLDNVIDWGISRERYWGTPLPFWVCEKCGKTHVVGSRDELSKLVGKKVDVELHKPYIDEIQFTCDKCGGVMTRTPEVIDCWYDSGSMPFAQFHYPFENKKEFEKYFPADFISEAVDQTRGWFYTLLVISTLAFDIAPFKNCIVLGHVNDANGIKMSKHKGNVVDPWSVLDKQGADAVRWYFYTGSSPWLPSRFSADNVAEAQRKFMGTLWNTYAFYVLYAQIDKFDPTKYPIEKMKLTIMDKWILSKLNSLIKEVNLGLDQYKITETARAIQDFTDELSNWYVRRSRERYWGSDMDEDKSAAYATLYHVLLNLSKLIAPYTPFMAEQIYNNLVVSFDKKAPISVHLCKYPEADEKRIDKKLEKDMSLILDIVFLARAARAKANIKNRQPLSTLYVKSEYALENAQELDIIKGEINVESVEFIKSDGEYISYELKPQLKTLGPKYGKHLGQIREYLQTTKDAKQIVECVNNDEIYKFTIGETEIELAKDDLLISIQSAQGFAVESNNAITVILDVTISDDLLDKGIARELVSKIQTMRKDAGYEVVDHIKMTWVAPERTESVIEKFKKDISMDVLCDEMDKNLKLKNAYTKDWDINGELVKISIEKI